VLCGAHVLFSVRACGWCLCVHIFECALARVRVETNPCTARTNKHRTQSRGFAAWAQQLKKINGRMQTWEDNLLIVSRRWRTRMRVEMLRVCARVCSRCLCTLARAQTNGFAGYNTYVYICINLHVFVCARFGAQRCLFVFA
jgi:hypothetical protein